jgi:hypothetical protein
MRVLVPIALIILVGYLATIFLNYRKAKNEKNNTGTPNS